MIRELQSSELRKLHPLMEKFLEEFKHPAPFSKTAFDAYWLVILGKEIGKIFVAEENGAVVGALGCVRFTDPFTGAEVSLENFWYVLPEHRRGKAGIALLDAFEADAPKTGAEWTFLCHLSVLNSEMMDRLYARRGYRNMETVFWRKL